MSSDSYDESEEVITDLSEPTVVMKYKESARIANQAVIFAAKQVIALEEVADICELTDQFILAQTDKLYRKKKILKGIAFPTCISINEVGAYYCPVKSDSEQVKISPGDIVKIHLGVHFDGYASYTAQTIVVPLDDNKNQAVPEITGQKAKVIAAAHLAYQAALRLMHAGRKNTEVTKVMKATVEAMGCALVKGSASYQLDQFIMEGENVIEGAPANANDPCEEITFATNEVYALDVLVVAGEDGALKKASEHFRIFRRDETKHYQLKRSSSRALLKKVVNRHSALPFSWRELTDQKDRLGLKECLDHELLLAYPAMKHVGGGLIARVKGTILLMPSGTVDVNFIKEGARGSLEGFAAVRSDRKIDAPKMEDFLPAAIKPDVRLENKAILDLLARPVVTRKKKQ